MTDGNPRATQLVFAIHMNGNEVAAGNDMNTIRRQIGALGVTAVWRDLLSHLEAGGYAQVSWRSPRRIEADRVTLLPPATELFPPGHVCNPRYCQPPEASN